MPRFLAICLFLALLCISADTSRISRALAEHNRLERQAITEMVRTRAAVDSLMNEGRFIYWREE